MKKLLFLLSILTITSQAQDGFNFQGAAVDANGDELQNQSISIKTVEAHITKAYRLIKEKANQSKQI